MEVHCTTQPSGKPMFVLDDVRREVSAWEAYKDGGAFAVAPEDMEHLYRTLHTRRRFIARVSALPPLTIVIHDDALESIPLKWLRTLHCDHVVVGVAVRLVGDPCVLYGPEQGYDQRQLFARLFADLPY